MEKEGSYVAMTRCYLCGGDKDIILHTRMKDISEVNGKVVDMSPCNKCQELMKQGIIMITIDSEKSDKDWDKPKDGEIPNPYRTGGFFVVKDEAVTRMLEGNQNYIDWVLKHRWMFIEHSVAEQIGLFDQLKEAEDEREE